MVNKEIFSDLSEKKNEDDDHSTVFWFSLYFGSH